MRDLECSAFPSVTSLNQWTTATRRVSGRHRTEGISYPVTPEQLVPNWSHWGIDAWWMCDCLAASWLQISFHGYLTINSHSTYERTWFHKHMEFPGSWMKTPQDFHCSGVTGRSAASGTKIIYFPCLWSWIIALGSNPRLPQMMKTSLRAYVENSANMDAIRNIQLSICWENCVIHTLHEEGGLRTPV